MKFLGVIHLRISLWIKYRDSKRGTIVLALIALVDV